MDKKIIVAIVAIGLVAVSFGVYAYTSVDWEEGAPSLELTCSITEVTTEYKWESSIDIDEGFNSFNDAAQFLPVASTMVVGVQPLDPLSIYTITFTTKAITTGASSAETYTTTAYLSGNQTKTLEFSGWPTITDSQFVAVWDGGNGYMAEASTSSSSGVETTITLPHFTTIHGTIESGTQSRNIMGGDIDGATFALSVVSESVETGFGQTTVDIELVVGAGGNLHIEIAEVTTDTGFDAGNDIVVEESKPQAWVEEYLETEAMEDGTRASWLGSGWGYRQGIVVSNSGATAVNCVVRADLNATNGFNFSHVQADMDDVRFTLVDSETEIDHWHQWYDVSLEDSAWWFEVPSLPNGNTIIYAYYGNALASSASNGSACFRYFEDFSGSRWTSRDVTETNPAGFYNKGNDRDPIFVLNNTGFNESANKMIGLDVGYVVEDPYRMCYGSYFNATYAGVLGASSSNGMDWTRNTYMMLNHSTVAGEPDTIKCAEPDWMNNITSTYQEDITYKHYTDSYWPVFYSGLNSTNWSVNFAFSDTWDAEWTKLGAVLTNGTAPEFDSVGVRNPVVWCEGVEEYYLLYSGYDGSKWRIGYATSADMVTWTKQYQDSYWGVFNGSTDGWDYSSVIPLDVWDDGTYYWISYAGMAGTDWRTGLAYTEDLEATWNLWGGVTPWGDTGTWDADDNQYGAGMVINQGTTNDYVWYHTGMNASYTSLGYCNVYNHTYFSNNGTGNTCFGLYDNKLRVDWNGTYLLNDFDGWQAGGNTNTTCAYDYWIRSDTILALNNSIIARASGDAFDNINDEYRVRANFTDDVLSIDEAANGAFTVHNNSALNYARDAQHWLSISCSGSTIYGWGEGHASDNRTNLEATDATQTDGAYGIGTSTPGTIDIDYFRVNNFLPGTIGASYGSELGQDDGNITPEDDPTSDGGGAGGDQDLIDTADDEIPSDEEEDEGFWEETCGLTYMMLAPCGICVGMVVIKKFDRRKEEDEEQR